MNSLVKRLSRFAVIALFSGAALVSGQVHAQPQDITFLLPSSPNTLGFAPWMIALQKGYYSDENLKVNFIAGRGGVDVAKQIGAGNAIIGGAIGDTSIIARANGIPVTTVALLGSGTLTMLAVPEAGPIKSVKDLKGKTITVISYADSTYYSLLGSLSKVGLNKNDVSIQAAGPTGVWQLLASRKSDAMAGVPDWVVAIEETGMPLRLLPADEAFRSMAQAILASDEIIKKDPDLIGRLVRATLRGMQDIMKDPKAAAADYVKAVPQYDGRQEMVERVFRLYNKHVYADQKTLGEMDPRRLDAVQAFYVSEGIVSKAQPLDTLYTNQFVTGVP